MVGQVISMVSSSIGQAILWLEEMFDSMSGVSVIVLASFLIYTAVRLLLKPFIGYASSDLATRGIKNKQKQRQKEPKKSGKGK